MAKFRKKPVEIEAYTFDEFIEIGINTAKELVNGVPWAFDINGYPITHCSNDLYLITTLEGNHNMTRDDILIIGVKGEIYPCKKDIFDLTYEKVE